MTSRPHSGRLSDADYYALVNVVTSRYDCDKIGRGIVDRDGMRAEFDRVLNGLFEQLEAERSKVEVLQHIVDGYPNLKEQLETLRAAILDHVEGRIDLYDLRKRTGINYPVAYPATKAADAGPYMPSNAPTPASERLS